MKYFICCLGILLLLCSCAEDIESPVNENSNYEFTISRNNIVLGYECGSNDTVSVYSYKNHWSISNTCKWLNIIPEQGDDDACVSFIASSENPSAETVRKYITAFTMSDSTKKEVRVVNIEQQRASSKVEIEYGNLCFSAREQYKKIDVQSNCPWEISEKSGEWFAIEQTNNSVIVKVDENQTIEERQGYFIISSMDSRTSTICCLSQDSPGLSLDETHIDVESRGASYTVNVECEVAWKAESSCDWVIIDTTESHSNHLDITVLPNQSNSSRIGIVRVKIGENHLASIIIKQEKGYTTPSVSNIKAGSKGGNIVVDINSNDNWDYRIANKYSWYQCERTQNGLIVKIEDNASVKARRDVIELYGSNGKITDIVIEQNGRYLFADQKSLYLNSEAHQRIPITIYTDGDYNILCDCKWIKCTKINENDIIFIDVEKNIDSKFRCEYITLELIKLVDSTSLQVKIPVYQAGHGENSVIVSPFGEDEDWSSYDNSNNNIGIKTFTDDEDWTPLK